MTDLERKLLGVPGTISGRFWSKIWSKLKSGVYSLSTFLKSGGVLASTWELKQKEHTGAHVDLDKNVQITVANNDYQLAA
jgi:hypothetical protein